MRSTFVLSGTLTDRPCDSWLTGTPMRCDARCSTTSDVDGLFGAHVRRLRCGSLREHARLHQDRRRGAVCRVLRPRKERSGTDGRQRDEDDPAQPGEDEPARPAARRAFPSDPPCRAAEPAVGSAPNARPVEPAGPPLLSYRGQPTGEHAARTVLPLLPHSRTSVLLADSLYSSGASSLVRRS